MTPQEAVRHLRARAKIQREQKTSYNRLRWTVTDLTAVETLLEFLAQAAQRAKDARG